MSADLPHMDRSYRRGAVMGLTIAEAFILIAFALLLLFAFWQWEVQQENTPEVQTFRTLTEDQQQKFSESIKDGSMDTFLALKERGVDLSRQIDFEAEREKWRFIDKDDQRRLLDAFAELPEDVQRDLADMVSANDAVPILKQLSALKTLVDSGQMVNVESILEANSRLGQISRKIQAAATQEAELVGTLRQQLGGIVSSVGGYIDDTGAIILPDAVLFEQGQASITPRLSSFLAQACAPWLTTLKESGIQIAEVKIEGHASSEWRKNSTPREAFLGNLDLSQRRSQAVLRVCLDFVPDQTVLEWARKHLIAIGYSSVRPVLRDGSEDQVASRRVVFSVAPDRDALIEEIESDASRDSTSKASSTVSDYDRARFGAWDDEDANCMNTRHEMLAANNIGQLILSEDGCSVERGLWRDPYSGREFSEVSDVEIDHLVPLYWTWEHGAKNWTTKKRHAFFNDPIGLFVVDATVNQQKGSRGPLDWLPPNEGFQCQYVSRFQRVLVKYQIELDEGERKRFDELSDEICQR